MARFLQLTDLHVVAEGARASGVLDTRALLEAAIDRLPTRQRTAVILSHLEGGTAREVSVVMGLNESTVRVHLFRAVRKLRGLLDRDGWTARGRTTPDRTSRRAARSEPRP